MFPAESIRSVAYVARIFLIISSIYSVQSAIFGTIPLPDRMPPAGFDSRRAAIVAMMKKEIDIIKQPEGIPVGVREFKDLQYTLIGDRSLELDLYIPEKASKKPTLLFIHGGSWSGGSRDIYRYYTVLFAKKGYATATVSYRLSGEAPYPAAIEDVQSAVRWLRSNAQKYDLNSDHIVALGGSSGGHLALMLAYSPEIKSIESINENENHEEENDKEHYEHHENHEHHKDDSIDESKRQRSFSSDIQAVVNLYGPVDLTTKQGRESNSVHTFLGKTYAQSPSLYREASPIFHLTEKAPPTLTIHGTLDEVVGIHQADMLTDRLKTLGVPYAYVRLEGWTHRMDFVKEVNDYCVMMIESFLKQCFPMSK